MRRDKNFKEDDLGGGSVDKVFVMQARGPEIGPPIRQWFVPRSPVLEWQRQADVGGLLARQPSGTRKLQVQ